MIEPEDQQVGVLDRPSQPRILVVDRSSEGPELCRRLARQGYTTYAARRYDEAGLLARQHQPHVVLLDLGKRPHEGLAFCAQFSDAPETCGIPVIVLSRSSGDVVRRVRSAGGRFYVGKPYDPNVLLALIEASLRETW